MKNLLIIPTIISLTFMAGYIIAYNQNKQEALTNGAGYYEQMTGNFRFAPVPLTVPAPTGISLDALGSDVMTAIPKPPRKPVN